MRTVFWIWIIVATAALLFFPPTMKRQAVAAGKPGYWQNAGPFEESVFNMGASYRRSESRVDYSRLLAVFLAINFLPAALLWKWTTISDWLKRHRKKLAISVGALVLLFAAGGIYSVYESERNRAEYEKTLQEKQLAEEREAQIKAARSALPPGFEIESTPEPQIRKAIPVTP